MTAFDFTRPFTLDNLDPQELSVAPVKKLKVGKVSTTVAASSIAPPTPLPNIELPSTATTIEVDDSDDESGIESMDDALKTWYQIRVVIGSCARVSSQGGWLDGVRIGDVKLSTADVWKYAVEVCRFIAERTILGTNLSNLRVLETTAVDQYGHSANLTLSFPSSIISKVKRTNNTKTTSKPAFPALPTSLLEADEWYPHICKRLGDALDLLYVGNLQSMIRKNLDVFLKFSLTLRLEQVLQVPSSVAQVLASSFARYTLPANQQGIFEDTEALSWNDDKDRGILLQGLANRVKDACTSADDLLKCLNFIRTTSLRLASGSVLHEFIPQGLVGVERLPKSRLQGSVQTKLAKFWPLLKFMFDTANGMKKHPSILPSPSPNGASFVGVSTTILEAITLDLCRIPSLRTRMKDTTLLWDRWFPDLTMPPHLVFTGYVKSDGHAMHLTVVNKISYEWKTKIRPGFVRL